MNYERFGTFQYKWPSPSLGYLADSYLAMLRAMPYLAYGANFYGGLSNDMVVTEAPWDWN